MDEGERLIEIRIYDLDGNVASDSVSVLFINDDLAPTIDSPEDITLEYNSVGSNIIWTPQDEYPDTYTVTRNGTTIVSDSWDGSMIILNLDGLEVGIYDFEVTAVDCSGLSASDVVRVTIESNTDGILPLPFADLVLITGAIAGAIVVVVVVIKKRKTG